MARKQTTKATKTQSVKEFKAWLSGILEFQSSDWVPNAEQWRTIQEKINLLPDEPVQVREPVKTIPQESRRVESAQPTQPTLAHQHENVVYMQTPAQSSLMTPHGDAIALLPENPIEFTAPSVETVSSRVVPSNKRTIPAGAFISQDPTKSSFT